RARNTASTFPEEAIQAVAESSPRASATDASHPDFGANEWLVEEMYNQFSADPSSVDAAWADFFRKGGYGNGAKPAANGSGAPATPEKTPAERAAEEKNPPAPATAPASPKSGATQPRTAPKPVAVKPSSTPIPKTPPPPAEPPTDPGEVERVVLRGAAARTATNMDASLAVPTATSVRSVPVKLLFDQRIVINNHLARARGGKVSFTHLIGYAVVQAIKSMPEMNTGFEYNEKGKPVQLHPEHVNFGLAIDVQKSDGSRQLMVPNIKAAETMDFAQFWRAYETIVRKARDGKLEVSDFQGTTVSLTNPGGIGTNHSVPRLMTGQGLIVGVGSMEYP